METKEIITGPGLYRLEGCDEPAEVTGFGCESWSVTLPKCLTMGDGCSRTGRAYASNGNHVGISRMNDDHTGHCPRIIGPWTPPWKPTPGEYAVTRDGRKAFVGCENPHVAADSWSRFVGYIIEGPCPTSWNWCGRWSDESSISDLIGPWQEPKPPRVVEADIYEVDGGFQVIAIETDAKPAWSRTTLSGPHRIRITDGVAEIVEVPNGER